LFRSKSELRCRDQDAQFGGKPLVAVNILWG
jgi:hypothetical protein